uniref:Uncharacterized protein n=1 Tax=Alexandrium catenella TaxID=2925 RepID=A0A7S1S0V5_ALECA
MSHLHRALFMVTDPQRPLIVLDHMDDVATVLKANPGSGNADVIAMRSMLLYLIAWCNTVCYDDGIADVVVCCGPNSASSTWWTRRPSPDMSRFEGTREFRAAFEKLLQ